MSVCTFDTARTENTMTKLRRVCAKSDIWLGSGAKTDLGPHFDATTALRVEPTRPIPRT